MILALLFATATATAAIGKPQTVREYEFYLMGERARLAGEGWQIKYGACKSKLQGERQRSQAAAEIVTEAPANCPPLVVDKPPQIVEKQSAGLWPLIGAGCGGAAGALIGALLREDRLGPTIGGAVGAIVGVAFSYAIE